MYKISHTKILLQMYNYILLQKYFYKCTITFFLLKILLWMYNYVFPLKNTFVNIQLHFSYEKTFVNIQLYLNLNIIVHYTFTYTPLGFFDQPNLMYMNVINKWEIILKTTIYNLLVQLLSFWVYLKVSETEIFPKNEIYIGFMCCLIIFLFYFLLYLI
jgi:hypothetical protein